MERVRVRVSKHLLWSGSSTKTFYQIIKSTNTSVEAFDDSSNNVHGRSSNFREYFGKNTYSTRLCDFPSAAARFCDKFQEMNFQPIQEIQSWTKYLNKL